MIFEKSISLLKSLFPMKGTTIPKLYERELPLWLRRAAKFYTLELNKTSIGLIQPQTKLGFETLQKMQRQIEKKEHIQWLIIADNVNPKYRALFVKNQVPFIFKDQSIFAPMLGTKLQSKQLKNSSEPDVTIVSPSVSPMGLKLLAGYLTDQLKIKDFNLDDLQFYLKKNACNFSKTTLSRTINDLIHRDLVLPHSLGPKRKLTFKSKKEVWQHLCHNQIKTGSQLLKVRWHMKKKESIYSGESALSYYSDLAPPLQKTIALTKKDYDSLRLSAQREESSEESIFIEVRKIDPKLFSIKKHLNPIELYFELKNYFDERVQLSLSKMLKQFKLE